MSKLAQIVVPAHLSGEFTLHRVRGAGDELHWASGGDGAVLDRVLDDQDRARSAARAVEAGHRDIHGQLQLGALCGTEPCGGLRGDALHRDDALRGEKAGVDQRVEVLAHRTLVGVVRAELRVQRSRALPDLFPGPADLHREGVVLGIGRALHRLRRLRVLRRAGIGEKRPHPLVEQLRARCAGGVVQGPHGLRVGGSRGEALIVALQVDQIELRVGQRSHRRRRTRMRAELGTTRRDGNETQGDAELGQHRRQPGRQWALRVVVEVGRRVGQRVAKPQGVDTAARRQPCLHLETVGKERLGAAGQAKQAEQQMTPPARRRRPHRGFTIPSTPVRLRAPA